MELRFLAVKIDVPWFRYSLCWVWPNCMQAWRVQLRQCKYRHHLVRYHLFLTRRCTMVMYNMEFQACNWVCFSYRLDVVISCCLQPGAQMTWQSRRRCWRHDDDVAQWWRVATAVVTACVVTVRFTTITDDDLTHDVITWRHNVVNVVTRCCHHTGSIRHGFWRAPISKWTKKCQFNISKVWSEY